MKVNWETPSCAALRLSYIKRYLVARLEYTGFWVCYHDKEGNWRLEEASKSSYKERYKYTKIAFGWPQYHDGYNGRQLCRKDTSEGGIIVYEFAVESLGKNNAQTWYNPRWSRLQEGGVRVIGRDNIAYKWRDEETHRNFFRPLRDATVAQIAYQHTKCYRCGQGEFMRMNHTVRVTIVPCPLRTDADDSKRYCS